jgi:hypothetical protein
LSFYQQCLRTLKEENQAWVALLDDTNEFIVPRSVAANPPQQDEIRPPPTESTTISGMIRNYRHHRRRRHRSPPCFPMNQ